MLRLSEEDGRVMAEFQAMHPAAREAGFGRIFRSPTLFEAMVECIFLCNCQYVCLASIFLCILLAGSGYCIFHVY